MRTHCPPPAMNRRLRLLAGILTLTAMTASFAETVLASVCAPMGEMDGANMAAMAGMGGMGMSTVDVAVAGTDGIDCPLMTEHGDDRGGQRNDHCPLNPAVGAGCTAVASLPACATLVATPAGETSKAWTPGEARPDLLLSHALFHPPRA